MKLKNTMNGSFSVRSYTLYTLQRLYLIWEGCSTCLTGSVETALPQGDLMKFRVNLVGGNACNIRNFFLTIFLAIYYQTLLGQGLHNWAAAQQAYEGLERSHNWWEGKTNHQPGEHSFHLLRLEEEAVGTQDQESAAWLTAELPDSSVKKLTDQLAHEPVLQWTCQEEDHHHPKEVTLQRQRLRGEASLKPQALQQERVDAQVWQAQEEESNAASSRWGGICHSSLLLFSAFVDFSS